MTYIKTQVLFELMTIIVAVRKGKKAAIAADTQYSQGNTVVPGDMRSYPKKIHNVAGAYVGIAGTSAHHSVFRSLAANKPDLFNFDNAEAIFETFRRIHPILKKEYFVYTNESDGSQEYESNQMNGLIVSKGGIYSFFSYREIAEYRLFWACGSGKSYSLGALDALYTSRKPAKEIAELGVLSACKFDKSCGLPLESYEIDLES
ncbi:MAG: MFS transporter [Gammaproteobacteria bacterium]